MRSLSLSNKLQLLYCFLFVGIAKFSFAGKYGAFAHFNFSIATDTTITVCGTSTVLNTQTVPGYSNPIWNNGATGNSLTVNAPGDYWWQVTGTSVVTNGDFSSSTRGFNSSYTYKSAHSTCNQCCCGLLSLESTYAINTNPSNIHNNFTSFGDHTTGSGNMLIVNGASTPNVTVWDQSITVSAHTDYVFSAWVTSAYPQNPAQLQFSINGSPLGSTITPSSNDGVWQYFTTTWNSGNTSGPVPIALVNQNIQANGNDFAVDDIVFAPVYRQNIHVTLNPLPVLTLTSPHAACEVYDITTAIVGYDPATYAYVIKNGAGNIITNIQAITQSGTYTLTEQNKATGCTSLPMQTTITITPSPQKPGISAL